MFSISIFLHSIELLITRDYRDVHDDSSYLLPYSCSSFTYKSHFVSVLFDGHCSNQSHAGLYSYTRIHISGQWSSLEAQGRSLTTDRTLQIVTLEMAIVCIRVASFHTTRDSVALGQCYSVGRVHTLVRLGLTLYLRWESRGPRTDRYID